MMSIRVLLLACALALASVAAQYPVPPMPTITALDGHPGLYVLQSWMSEGVPYGMNLLSVGDDDVILIDTHNPGNYAQHRAAIDSITSRNVSIVINTHYHPDHAGLNADFRRAGTQRIIAAKGVKEELAKNHTNLDFPPAMQFSPASSPDSYPTESVPHQRSLISNDEHFRLYVLAGGAHSGHDMIIMLEKANIVYCGDIVAPYKYPFIDRPVGGSLHGMIAASRQILSFVNEETVIIPTHGGICNRAALLDYINALERIEVAVTEVVQSGGTLEQVMALPIVAELHDPYGLGFITDAVFFTIVYRDIAGIPAC